ncbi:RecX family transcriptional regulator [soil metagenome]
MKITSIKQQIKNPERASLFVDGKYSFSLSLNELIAERLKINQDLDDAELKRLIKLSVDGKLKARALEWVMNRPRSLRELKDYLYRKKAEPEQIESLLSQFEARGFISDKAFAEWLIDMRSRGGKSTRAISNELMKKGVSREMIQETLKKDYEQERAMLKTLVDKRRQLSRYKNDEIKLKQYLLRRGFSYDDIKSVLSDAG